MPARTPGLHVENGVARVRGDLTFATVRSLYEQMREASRAGGLPQAIDLAEVEQIDSGGLALLLEWQADFSKQSRESVLMQVRNAPDSLVKIARLCDAQGYLGIGDGSPEASSK